VRRDVVLVALPSGRTLGTPALLLSLALLLPLVLRRRRPVLVAALVFSRRWRRLRPEPRGAPPFGREPSPKT
jgi:hypothetical protein